jgi:hypothetical protein
VFRISPNAVRLAAQVREKENAKPEPRDIVAEVTERARGNRLIATLILVSLVISSIVVPLAGISAIIYYWMQISRIAQP